MTDQYASLMVDALQRIHQELQQIRLAIQNASRQGQTRQK